MLVIADYLREKDHHATSARYFAQEANWGNAAIGRSTPFCTGSRQISKPDAARSQILHSPKRRGGKFSSFSRIFLL